MWTYQNPVKITFGNNGFSSLPALIDGRSYALVTYPDAPFDALAQKLISDTGQPVLIIRDIAPNPDYKLLEKQTAEFAKLSSQPDVIVALVGGSVIDSAKAFAAAAIGGFGCSGGRFFKSETLSGNPNG